MPITNISVLGSTGSIGRQTLEVIAAFPQHFRVAGLAAKENVKLLAQQVKEFKPKYVSVHDEKTARKLAKTLKGVTIEIHYGSAGLKKIATLGGVKMVVIATSGTAALEPALAAIARRKNIALASKEILVAAGKLVMTEAKKHQVKLIPIDSEHSAIYQCLAGEDIKNVKRIILTASGGPFLKTPLKKLAKVTPEEALRHPNWRMGEKISIDSATLMNKGLEIIEAHHLFGLDFKKIDVIIHPQSIIHSMVEFTDGSVKAQLSPPDMHLPIQYALMAPARLPNSWPKIDFSKNDSLTFLKVDKEKYPCLELAYKAGKIGGTLPTIMNAANEEAVRLFLKKKIAFSDIPQIVKRIMFTQRIMFRPKLNDILSADRRAREEVSAYTKY